MCTGPIVVIMNSLRFQETTDTLNNKKSACQVPDLRIISASFKTLSSRTETSQPRTWEVLFLTQRLQTAQIDTQTPKRAHWISAQRAHNSPPIFKHNWDHNHTRCDKDPPNRPKSSRQKQMRTAQILHTMETDSQSTRTLSNLIRKP